MFFTIEQIKAARALLKWNAEELANRAGVTANQIREYESGRTRSLEVAEAIHFALTKEGIKFTKTGVDLDPDTVVTVEGEGWYLKLLDDVYQTLVDQPEAELLCFFTDDRVSPPEVNGQLRKMRNAGIKVRQLVEEGNTYLMGPVKEYRYIPKASYHNHVSLVYGDKVAACMRHGTKATIIKDADVSESWRNVFNLLWTTLKQPGKSNATERF